MNRITHPRPEILLHPNIPKPLHGLAPRVFKSEAWWSLERIAASMSTNFRCAACWVPKAEARYHPWLEAHELYEFDWKHGRLTYVETVPLCHACHQFIHSGRMHVLVDKGEMPESKMEDILDHGHAILKKAKLRKKDPPASAEKIPWSDWRMVIDGVEHAPKFKNYGEWYSHYNDGQKPPTEIEAMETFMAFDENDDLYE